MQRAGLCIWGTIKAQLRTSSQLRIRPSPITPFLKSIMLKIQIVLTVTFFQINMQ